MAFDKLTDRQRRLLLTLCKELNGEDLTDFHASHGLDGWSVLLYGLPGTRGKKLDDWVGKFAESDLQNLAEQEYIRLTVSQDRGSPGYRGSLRPKALEEYRQHLSGDETVTLPPATTPLPGRLPPGYVLGDYRILEELGHGGMGRVYKAEHLELKGLHAIKVLSPEALRRPAGLERFRREVRVMRGLRHRNVCGVFEYSERRDRPYYVMEYLEGETLQQLIERGPMAFELAVEILGQLAAGLRALHEEDVVHRDIKPGNVIQTPTGRVVLLDFGLAKEPDAPPLTETGEVLGTRLYWSPEQGRGAKVDERTDVYALALVAYEVLSGQSDRPPKLDGIRDGLRPVLERALKDDPAKRTPSVEAFWRELQQTLAAEGAAPVGAGVPAGPEGVNPTAEAAALRPELAVGFDELVFEPDPDGPRRFVWRVPGAWDATTPEVPNPEPVTPEQWFWLRAAIWLDVHEYQPRAVPYDDRNRAPGPFVYETDARTSFKQKVAGTPPGGKLSVLALDRRSPGARAAICIRDRHFVPASGNFCNQACGRSVKELLEAIDTERAEYRAARKRPPPTPRPKAG